MTTDRKPPGRPRLYETASEKVGAFRRRQASAGYLRKEVLITRETAERLAELAVENEVSALDVASALLEHGLSTYDDRSSYDEPSGPQAPPAVAWAPTLEVAAEPPRAAAEVDPIRRFFEKRKRSLNHEK
jgi:hypothetical protein